MAAYCNKNVTGHLEVTGKGARANPRGKFVPSGSLPGSVCGTPIAIGGAHLREASGRGIWERHLREASGRGIWERHLGEASEGGI